MPKTNPNIVVLGGGTGSFALLQGIKHYTTNITAVVNMSDDGGSTGILRDELGVLPPGDARQCLVALSNSPDLRDLFSYRFDEGSQKGHSVGNLIISALERLHGSFDEAIRIASEILAINGAVVPVTLQNHMLVLRDGDKTISGQHNIDNHTISSTAQPVIRLVPESVITPTALSAISQADITVIAPGSVYTSLLPLLAVTGIPAALKQSQGTVVCVTNLITKPGQTDGWHVVDHIQAFEKYLGAGTIQTVLYNNKTISARLLKRYAADNEFPVSTDPSRFSEIPAEAIGVGLVSSEIAVQDPADTAVRRTLIRHDGDEVGRQLLKLLGR